MEGKKIRRRTVYVPIAGSEHCPVCWVASAAVVQLRAEQHHNGDRVSVAVCDSCGLFQAI
jgi:hypothetical protein